MFKPTQESSYVPLWTVLPGEGSCVLSRPESFSSMIKICFNTPDLMLIEIKYVERTEYHSGLTALVLHLEECPFSISILPAGAVQPALLVCSWSGTWTGYHDKYPLPLPVMISFILTLKLLGPAAGVSGSLTVTVA